MKDKNRGQKVKFMSNDNIYKEQRLQKMHDLRAKGIEPYQNTLIPQNLAHDLMATYDSKEASELEALNETFSLAGRVIFIRSFGKAGFMKLRDRSGEFQVFFQKGKMADEDSDTILSSTDVGDIVYVTGQLFRTKTNELTLKIATLRMVTKALEQLPEKWHGLTDVEARYRRRYVDLIANPEVKEVFIKRSKTIAYIRQYFHNKGFLEVETPMMQPIPGGAKARPFITHHNTLDRDLYLRIAPELYLKRLVVGGMERVFEINRNFRNEGISTQHNPEFTMLEFYMTYATYEDLIKMTEDLLSELALHVCGSPDIVYQGQNISLKKPFARYSVAESLQKFVGMTAEESLQREALMQACEKHKIRVKNAESCDIGFLQMALFDDVVQPQLIQPTFITLYPTCVSPLSRRNDNNPNVTDRFEFFVYGREIANAFSELNDPIDQKNRFMAQVEERDGGDDEAMYYDGDFITALEYGMPSTAGEGIGIDRLVMLLADAPSIRDVILFPILRAE